MTEWDFSRAEWKKSTRSTNNGGSCVEVATTADHAVAVRDSKDRTGPVLVFAPDQWTSFLQDIRTGSFNLH